MLSSIDQARITAAANSAAANMPATSANENDSMLDINLFLLNLQRRIPGTIAGRVTAVIGLCCLIAAIVFIFLPQGVGKFSMPLWAAFIITAILSFLLVLYHMRMPSTTHTSKSLTCVRYLKKSALQTAVVSVVFAILLAAIPKYKDFFVTMAPEVFLMLGAYLCWMGVRFFETL